MEVRLAGRPGRLFYGWIVVASSFVGYAFVTGLGFTGFSTFIVPLEREFGWSKAALAAARSLMQVEAGLLGPVEGFLVDKVGPRLTITVGMFIFGLSLVLLGLIQSLWAYYAVFTLMAIGSSIGGFLVMATAVNSWFRRKRTLAMSVFLSGMGFGGIVLVPILVWAQDVFGWRGAAIAGGLFTWAVCIPLAQLLRRSPERHGLLPDGDSLPEVERRAPSDTGGHPKGTGLVDFTVWEAMRTRAFWMIGLGHSVSTMAFGGAAVNQFAHMEQGVGLARSSAALVIVVHSAALIVGRLIGGFAGDRLGKRYVGAIAVGGITISLVILATAHALWQAMAFGVVMGLAWGMRGPVSLSIRGDYFGRASFGKITGFISLIFMPATLFGPVFAGLMADIQGDYRMGFLILAALSGVGVPAFLLALPPRPPQRVRHALAESPSVPAGEAQL